MAEVVKCEALVEFTEFVDGHGMVHGSPKSTLDEAKFPLVPVGRVTEFAERGLIKGTSKGKKPVEEPASAAEPVDKAP